MASVFRTIAVIVGAVLATVAWISLFGAGCTISSTPYRADVSSPLVFALVLVTYTPTNVSLLCCLAALSGALCRYSLLPDDPPEYASIVTRGHFIFMALASGLVVISAQPFTDPTLEAYIRVSAVSSSISFLAGVKPETFEALVEKIASKSTK